MTPLRRRRPSQWRELPPELLHDSLMFTDRDPFPADEDASVFRASHRVGLMGVVSEDLERAQRQYPNLSEAVTYLDRRRATRVAQLARGQQFAEHADYPGYHLAAITLAHYATRASMGLSALGDTFIEPGGEFDDKAQGGSVKTFGVHDIELFARTFPNVPILRRPTQG